MVFGPYYWPPPLAPWYFWQVTGYRYGAVERSSGTANTASYPGQDLPDFIRSGNILLDTDANNHIYDMFIWKHELRSRWLSISLYRQVGLSKLWDTMTKLYGMLQQTPPDIPGELRKYARLSMRDAYAACPQWLKGTPISLNEMCGDLSVPRPYSLSKLFSS